MEFDTTIFTQGALVAFVLVFLGGVVTSIGPCNIAMIPLVVGYVGGTTTPTRGRAFSLSLGFAVGLATTFMLLGVVAALLGNAFTGLAGRGYYLVALVCFGLGLKMLGACVNASAGVGCPARLLWGWFPDWWPRSAPRRCCWQF